MDIAVLIPAYRNQTGLNRSLESLAEAEGAFHVVIVDDGSAQPIEAPLRLRDDVPVTLLRVPRNQGIAGALNHGLRHILMEGFPYVARLDTGDTVARERFPTQQAFMEANPECAVVSSFVDFVDSDQTPLFRYRAPSQHRQIVQRMRLNSCIMHPGAMIRASALREAGIYREDIPGAEDYELFLRMSLRYTLAVLPIVLTRCEYAPNGLSIAGRKQQQKQRLKLQCRYFNFLCPYSFYGVSRTLLAMLVPHNAVFRFKRAHFRT